MAKIPDVSPHLTAQRRAEEDFLADLQRQRNQRADAADERMASPPFVPYNPALADHWERVRSAKEQIRHSIALRQARHRST